MNTKRFTLATLVGFVFIFAFDFIFHGILLQEPYEQTANLWRTEEAMQDFFAWMLAVQLGIVAVLAYIFTRNFENKGVMEGLRFGLMIGLFSGIAQLGMYAYMPIPISLAITWFVGAIIEFVGLGIIFSLLYKK